VTRWRLSWRFDPRDVWVGVYWNTVELEGHGASYPRRLEVFVCLVPFFPLYLRVPLRGRRSRR
jgi:hypothetical protein